MSPETSLDDYYPHIKSAVDSLGRSYVASDSSGEFGFVGKRSIVHPGDVVTFTCIGADKAARQLEFSFHTGTGGSQKKTAAAGEEVTLQWKVLKSDVTVRNNVTIDMKAVGAEYHRHGSNDHSVRFEFQVNPPGIN